MPGDDSTGPEREVPLTAAKRATCTECSRAASHVATVVPDEAFEPRGVPLQAAGLYAHGPPAHLAITSHRLLATSQDNWGRDKSEFDNRLIIR